MNDNNLTKGNTVMSFLDFYDDPRMKREAYLPTDPVEVVGDMGNLFDARRNELVEMLHRPVLSPRFLNTVAEFMPDGFSDDEVMLRLLSFQNLDPRSISSLYETYKEAEFADDDLVADVMRGHLNFPRFCAYEMVIYETDHTCGDEPNEETFGSVLSWGYEAIVRRWLDLNDLPVSR